jgi:glycosyltransferase involved in cell wall biosynthesis
VTVKEASSREGGKNVKKESIDLPNVSVVIPAFNIEPYIGRTLEGLVKQSLPPAEIVLVDDGSTDRTVLSAEEVLRNGNISFVLLQQENKGCSAARNRGLECARGEYVLFHDGDDIDEPDLLYSLTKAAETSGADMVFCGYDEVDQEGNVLLAYRKKFRYIDRVMKGKEVLSLYLKNVIWIFTGAVLYKRRFLVDNRLRFREGFFWAEDVDFISRALFSASTVSCVPRTMTHHLERPNSLSSNEKNRALRPGHAVGLYTCLWSELKKAGCSDDILQRIRTQYIASAYTNVLSMLITTGREDAFWKMARDETMRSFFRPCLSLLFEKPKIALRALQLLYVPSGFVRHYRKKRRKDPCQAR